MPRSAQSSLSHCTTTRPGMLAGSSGTTSSRRPAAITMPPECWPRWRGRLSSARRDLAEQARCGARVGGKPAAAEVGLRAASSSAISQPGRWLGDAIELLLGEARARARRRAPPCAGDR